MVKKVSDLLAQEKRVNLGDLPEIKDEDQMDKKAQSFEKIYFKNKDDEVKPSDWEIVKIVSEIFLMDIVKVYLFGLVDLSMNLMNSVSLEKLLHAMMENGEGKSDERLFWGFLLSICIFFSTVFKHNSWMYG